MASAAVAVIVAIVPEPQPRFPSEMPPRCQYCGDVLGVYEPVILIHNGLPHVTSRAAQAHLFPTTDPGYHKACYELDVQGGGPTADPR
jgi:hypothetical protein